MKNLFVILLFSYLSLVLFSSKMNAQANIQAIEDVHDVDFIHHSIAKYDSNSFIIAGTVSPAPVAGDSDILLIKIDLAGNIIWSKYIDYSIRRDGVVSNEFVGSIMVDSNKDILVVGYSYFVPPVLPGYSSSKNLRVTKLDGNGNLLDFLWIRDPVDHNGYIFNLYGFDIEQTNKGNYIVVGLGSHPPALISSDKYSFSIGINRTLDYLLWTKRYRSSSHHPLYIDNYNSFNHILKIPDHAKYGEVYLLTGGVATDDHEPFIMLVDPNGNEIWQSIHTKGTFPTTSLGIASLYDLNNNSVFSFYHAYDGTNQNYEDHLLVYEVDGNTGNHINTWSISVPNIGDDRLFINGMEWANTNNPKEETSIVFSGYILETNSNKARPVLFSVNFSNRTINWSHIYNPEFSVIEYENLLSFDQIIQPLHPMRLQCFYQPKSFTKNVNGYQYSSINQDYSTSFKTYFFNTAFGMVECVENFELSVNEVSGYITLWDMVPNKIPFDPIEGPYPKIYKTTPIGIAICASEHRGLNTKTNKEIKVSIYPNPVEDILYVDSQKDIHHMEVRNINGQVIYVDIHDDSMVDFSNVASGVYFIEIEIEGRKEIHKIIKR